MMIKMPRVVANFINVGRNLFGKPKVLLQINGQICRGSLADLGQRGRVLLAVDRYSYDTRTTLSQRLGLCGRRLHILCLCRCHALHSDRIAIANGDTADSNGTS